MRADVIELMGDRKRLAALRQLDVLDTPAERSFDRLTHLATRVLGVPAAVVDFVDESRQFLKSAIGLPEPIASCREIPLAWGFCPFALALQGPVAVDDVRADPEWADNEVVQRFGARAYLGVPLIHTGQPIGSFGVFDTEPHAWTGNDMDILRELAVSVMTEVRLRVEAKERQRLLVQQRHIAKVLQDSLLPPSLPAIPGLDLAARYHPAGAGMEVGGDFYDVFGTCDGEWAVVVGDVCGKGPEAAAVTALAHYTIRAASMAASAPSQVLATLNEAMLRQRVGRFCTLAYLRLVPAGANCHLTVSLAGHPPPLLLRPDGSVMELGGTGVPATGWFPDVAYHEQALDLAPGDTVVCYTDGVTEARSESELMGEERFKDLLGSVATETVDVIAERVLAGALDFQDGHAHDDIAVLVCRPAQETVSGAAGG
jgi:sigma-B regulation protein RsbU (phosphoserine phosphatase)